MRVFVTGATGFVGSAVVQELLINGHDVLGLARSEAAAQKITHAGAQPHYGDLEDFDSLRRGAENCDAVIHTGFIHDFSRYAEVCETDRQVIQAIGSALAGTTKPFIVTSGTALIDNREPAIETHRATAGYIPRTASEEAADAVAALGVRVAVVRLPPSVHGRGDYGFVPMLIQVSRDKGVSVYNGSGQNVWPAVHRLDAAKVYRLAIEKNALPGTRYHAVAETGIPFKDIAEVMGRRLHIPVISGTPQDAAEHFGWLAHFTAMHNPCSSDFTRGYLGWEPVHEGLLQDIDSDYYFE